MHKKWMWLLWFHCQCSSMSKSSRIMFTRLESCAKDVCLDEKTRVFSFSGCNFQASQN